MISRKAIRISWMEGRSLLSCPHFIIPRLSFTITCVGGNHWSVLCSKRRRNEPSLESNKWRAISIISLRWSSKCGRINWYFCCKYVCPTLFWKWNIPCWTNYQLYVCTRGAGGQVGHGSREWTGVGTFPRYSNPHVGWDVLANPRRTHHRLIVSCDLKKSHLKKSQSQRFFTHFGCWISISHQVISSGNFLSIAIRLAIIFLLVSQFVCTRKPKPGEGEVGKRVERCGWRWSGVKPIQKCLGPKVLFETFRSDESHLWTKRRSFVVWNEQTPMVTNVCSPSFRKKSENYFRRLCRTNSRISRSKKEWRKKEWSVIKDAHENMIAKNYETAQVLSWFLFLWSVLLKCPTAWWCKHSKQLALHYSMTSCCCFDCGWCCCCSCLLSIGKYNDYQQNIYHHYIILNRNLCVAKVQRVWQE